MCCDDYKKLILEDFDTGISPDKRSILEFHLNECQTCKAEFENLKHIFEILKKEKLYAEEECKIHINSINIEEIISKKSKKKWFEFKLNPAFGFALVILVTIATFFYVANLNQVSESVDVSENVSDAVTTDFMSYFINQNYIYENVDETMLRESEYFNDVVHFFEVLETNIFSYQNGSNNISPTIELIDEKEMTEIIAQLEKKNFLGE